jgi:hypothetical protein
MGHDCKDSIAFRQVGSLRCIGDVYLCQFLGGMDSWAVSRVDAPASVEDEDLETNAVVPTIKDWTTKRLFDADEKTDSAVEVITELPVKKRKAHRGKRGGRRPKSM